MEDAILALSRFRRRRFDDAIEISSKILEKNYRDEVSLLSLTREPIIEA